MACRLGRGEILYSSAQGHRLALEGGSSVAALSNREIWVTTFNPQARADRLNQDDFDVLENGIIVGRIFFLAAAAPKGRPWMWASGHNGDIRRAAHGFEPTREAAMAAFAKSWRRQ